MRQNLPFALEARALGTPELLRREHPELISLVTFDSARGWVRWGRVDQTLVPFLFEPQECEAWGTFEEERALALPESLWNAPEAFSERLFGWSELLTNLGYIEHVSEECLDVLGTNQDSREPVLLGTAPRSLFRACGLRTRAVRLVRFCEEPRSPYCLGKRSPSKRISPGLWDNLVAGLVSAGETPETALIREAQEEASLKLTREELVPLGAFESLRMEADGLLDEQTLLFGVKGTRRALKNTDGEVECFGLLTSEELTEAIEAGVVMNEAAWAFLVDQALHP